MTYQQIYNEKKKFLIKLVDSFPSVNFEEAMNFTTKKDQLTEQVLNIYDIDELKKHIKDYSDELKSYACRRLYNIRMSEIVEYLVCTTVYSAKKMDKYNRYGDVMINGQIYDVKLGGSSWSGYAKRKYNNQVYIKVWYESKFDVINSKKMNKLKRMIRNTKWIGEDVLLRLD